MTGPPMRECQAKQATIRLTNLSTFSTRAWPVTLCGHAFQANGAEIATPGQERRTAYLPNIPGSTEASLGLFPVDAQLLLLKLEGTADSGSPPTLSGRVFIRL